MIQILDGQASATIDLHVLDDLVADGTGTVVLLPSAPGYTGVSDSVDVLDDEIPQLTLTIQDAELGTTVTDVREGNRTTLRVERNTPVDKPLVVTLASTDMSEIRLGSGLVLEQAGNDSLQTPQNLDEGGWTTAHHPNIGDGLANTSAYVPHVSVQGTGDGTFDY